MGRGDDFGYGENMGAPEVNKRRKKARCKNCGKLIVQDTAGRGWRHGETGPYACYPDKYAEPRRAK